jgi:tetratricopeptide (TPR) repeat protein
VARNKSKTRELGSIAETVARLVLWGSRPQRGFARVEYHSEFARSEADRHLGEALRNQGIPNHQIALLVGRRPIDVMRTLLESLEPLEPAVVSIKGFAAAVPLGLRREFLGLLTLNRERLAACNHRQVWWMTPDFVDAFIHTVPDLDSWFMVRLTLTEEFTPPTEGPHLFEASGRDGSRYRLDEALRRATSLVERFQRAKEVGAKPAELLDLAAWAADAIVEVGAPILTRALSDQLIAEPTALLPASGPDASLTIAKLNSLARLLHEQGRMMEADPFIRQALAIARHIDHLDHPEIARELNNLAGLLQATNRLGEAEPLIRRALAIDEKNFGPEHSEVAGDLNNLVVVLEATNRLGEAEPLIRRALAIDEESLGPDHPEVASDLNNLGVLLKNMNRLDEAEPLYRRALMIDERSYGPSHSIDARDLDNLAVLFRLANRRDEAEPLFRRSLEIQERAYGPDHPNIASTLNNLADLLQSWNRSGDAEPLYRRALAIWEQSLGPKHPDVASVLNNLAGLLRASNRLSEAEPLMRRALEMLLRFSLGTGHEHPRLRAAISNYLGILNAMGQTPEQIGARLDEIGQPFGMALGG